MRSQYSGESGHIPPSTISLEGNTRLPTQGDELEN